MGLAGTEKKWLVEADILRALAIFLLVYGHFASRLSNFSFLNPQPGYLGIIGLINVIGLSLFFFISGYLLYRNNPAIKNINDIVTFYKKRVLRIIPLYWAAIIISFIIFGYYNISSIGQDGYTLKNLIMLILGLQIFEVSKAIPFMWFIGVILLFYILYPVVLYMSNSIKRILLFYITLLSVMLLLYVILPTMDNRMYMYLGTFIIGILMSKYNFFYDNKYAKTLPLLIIPLIITLVIEILLFDCAYFNIHGISIYNVIMSLLFLIVNNIFMITFCIISYSLIKNNLQIINKNTTSLIKKISYGAYAAYLFQDIWFYGLFKPVLEFITINSYVFEILSILVAFPLTFLIGYYIQKVEDTITNHVKKGYKFRYLKTNVRD